MDPLRPAAEIRVHKTIELKPETRSAEDVLAHWDYVRRKERARLDSLGLREYVDGELPPSLAREHLVIGEFPTPEVLASLPERPEKPALVNILVPAKETPWQRLKRLAGISKRSARSGARPARRADG